MILEKFLRYFFMFSHTDVHKVLTLKQSLPGIDPKSVQKQYKLETKSRNKAIGHVKNTSSKPREM